MNKKIGVIVFGEPRFINYTWRFIKEEFTLPGFDTYYFGHLWDKIGYCRATSEEDDVYEPHNISDLILSDFTDVKIDDDQCRFANTIEDFITKTHLLAFNKPRKGLTPGHPDRDKTLRVAKYRHGQFYSKQESYKLLQKYEKQTNIKFDIITTVKTDFIFMNQLCYITPTDNSGYTLYLEKRLNTYNGVSHNNSIVKTPGWNDKPPHGLQISGDLLVCSRNAGHSLLGEWFNTGLQVAKQCRDKPELWYKLKNWEMYGEIILRHNLKLQKISRGADWYRRVYNPDRVRRTAWLRNKNIPCYFKDIKTEQQHFQDQLLM